MTPRPPCSDQRTGGPACRPTRAATAQVGPTGHRSGPHDATPADHRAAPTGRVRRHTLVVESNRAGSLLDWARPGAVMTFGTHEFRWSSSDAFLSLPRGVSQRAQPRDHGFERDSAAEDQSQLDVAGHVPVDQHLPPAATRPRSAPDQSGGRYSHTRGVVTRIPCTSSIRWCLEPGRSRLIGAGWIWFPPLK